MRFASVCFETAELPTAGSPLLFAERVFEGADKTVLVYLQCDGQPVDPSRWHETSPNEGFWDSFAATSRVSATT